MASTIASQNTAPETQGYLFSDPLGAIRSSVAAWLRDFSMSNSLNRHQRALLERYQVNDLARRAGYWLLLLLTFNALALRFGVSPVTPPLIFNILAWTKSVWAIFLILSMAPYLLLLRQVKLLAKNASRPRTRRLHLLWSAWLIAVAFVWLSGNWALDLQPKLGGAPVLAQQFFVYLTILGQVFTVVLLSSSRIAVFGVLGVGIFTPFYFIIFGQLIANPSVPNPDQLTLTLHIFFTSQIVLYSIVGWCVAVTQKNYYAREILLESERAGAEAERVRAESERARANHFITAITHDVKQPLSALMYSLATLRLKAKTPELRAELEDLNEIAESLGKMVEASFDLSHIDSGALKLDVREHGLPYLVDEVVNEVRAAAAAKGVVFEHNEVPPFLVKTDEQAFLRILRNFLVNAIKYTPAKTVDGQPGRVLLECQQRDELLMCVSVIDDGTGIPKGKISDIFKEYVQLDNPERDRTKGVGLGLSIVERLAHRLGHTIDVDSEEGRGSRFSILVPIVGRIPPEYLPASADVVDFNGMTVTVVEDDKSAREKLHMLLSALGCYVIDGESHSELISNYKNEQGAKAPHLLLCDYRLKDGKTGVEAIEAIRREINPLLPAVIITAETESEVIREIAATYEVLAKPVPEQRLRNLLKKFSPKSETRALSD
jgi:two-component system, sensor histidine kinase